MPDRTSTWALLNARDQRVCDYIGIVECSVGESSQVLTEPIENGELAAYNKVQQPDAVAVSLAISGDPATQTAALAALKSLKQGTGRDYLCKLISPYFLVDNLALETISQSRSVTQNATSLIVELSFVRIRSISTSTSRVAWQPKNASSANCSDGGRVQPERTSLARLSDWTQS